MALRRSPRFLTDSKHVLSEGNHINNIIITENKLKNDKNVKKMMNQNITNEMQKLSTIPSLCRSKERQLRKNYDFVIGLDEAGRGPLAGPVVAAACLIPDDVEIPGIADSKSITEEMRNEAYQHLTTNPDIFYHVIRIEHDEIDSINILQASLRAMKLAAEGLLSKVNNSYQSRSLALVDGPKIPEDMPVPTQCVVKGDSLIYSIAAASIIAKVTRDTIMSEYHKLYPEYNFQQHKGYPTFAHRTILTTAGPSPIHRLTYAPVKAVVSVKNKYNIHIPEDLFTKEKKGKKRCIEPAEEESEIKRKSQKNSNKKKKSK